jgi:hypothetical protein
LLNSGAKSKGAKGAQDENLLLNLSMLRDELFNKSDQFKIIPFKEPFSLSGGR